MAAPHQVQRSVQAPARPAYILRGHSAQIHAVHFLRANTRLLTGDADGYVVLWNTSTRRAVAVWKAHAKTILGLRSWDGDKIITHGRDNKLCVWQLAAADESTFSTILPIDDALLDRKAPWLLHSLDVNALNFCSFAMVAVTPTDSAGVVGEGVLVAIPGLQDGHVNVISLPTEDRFATIPAPKDTNTGMVMAIAMHMQASSSGSRLAVVAGYESGHVAIFRRESADRHYQLTYIQKTHSQPVLSLCIAPKQGCVFSSSVDAIIGKHVLSNVESSGKTIQTKHAGQQDITVRSDERIFATAGWDTRVRVYSVKTMKELAVLKWHKEGCYALAFAGVTAVSAASDRDAESRESDHAALVRRDLTVAELRVEKASTTHWLAAGSKDGKVSLWDIY